MRLLWKALGFVAVLIVMAAAGVAFLPAERLGRIASDQLSKQLGRAVSLSEAQVSLWPVLGLKTGTLSIASPDWAGPEPMFRATSAAIGLDALAALQGRIEIKSLEAAAPDLRLITADGRSNWQFGAPAEASGDGSAALPLFTLDRLQITGGRLTYSADGVVTRLEDTDLTLRWPDMGGPLSFEAQLDPGGGPIALEGSLTRPRTALAGGAGPVDVTLKAGGGTIRFQGLAGPAPEAQGALTLALPNTARTVAVLGQVGIDLPEGLGRAITGTLQMTLTRDGRLALRDSSLSLDGNALDLAADIDLGAKPRINAQIRAAALDLSGLVGGTDEAEPAEGWSTARIDASGLGAFDGEIAVVTDALRIGALSFASTRALMTVADNRAVFELRELTGYDGVLTGSFVVNNRSGLSVRADLAFGGVALGPLLTDAMGITRLSGPADGSLSLLGSGSSTAAIIASLSGEGALRAGPGRISGIDLDQVLSGRAEGGTTIFDQSTGTFSISKGVLRNNDLYMELPRLQSKGEGRVDLGARSLDYLLTVLAPDARSGRGLAVPVRVKGAWSGPAITVDLQSAVDQNLAEERKALEDRARTKVGDALQERLGVTVNEGQSVEDALQEKLRSQAEKGLLNLLNR